MAGFGIDVKDENVIGDEDDARIVGHEVTSGNEEGGQQAMEALMQRDPAINLVYTINEPAAAGAYEALKSFGMEENALIVSIDGGCPGVQNVEAGVIGATAQQYPLLMASMGIEAIALPLRQPTAHQAGGERRVEFHRHRREPGHGPAGRGRAVDQRRAEGLSPVHGADAPAADGRGGGVCGRRRLP